MPKITKIKDNIITLKGTFAYQQNQMFNLSTTAQGMVITATKNEAKLLLIGDASTIKTQTEATIAKQKISQIDVLSSYFGAIISPWGKILKQPKTKKTKEVKIIATGDLNNYPPFLLDRQKLKNPLPTGMLTIDALIPLGLGQRELIIGDRGTGKTTIALNTIINQKNKAVKCVYVAIGQKTSSLTSIYHTLKKADVLKQTIIIFANPDNPAEQMLAPQIGMAMAEALAYQGEDIIVILDDLTKHANIYREISLSIGKNPGRESYPSDIFHVHAKLLERAGFFNKQYQEGSITCLPIVETVQNDVASLIPSNIISITDGQIFTSSELFNSGFYPAINIGLSVSRTGSAVQSPRIKKIAQGLKAQYASLAEVKKFADMAIEISAELQAKIKNWTAINNLLVQFGNQGYSEVQMEIMIILFRLGFFKDIINPIDFTLAFFHYCKHDEGAEKLITKLANNEINTLAEKEKAITVIFGPLAQVASGVEDGLISPQEYNVHKGDSNER